MTQIVPAILPKTYADVEEKAAKVSAFVSRVQLDIVDGVFAQGKTWPFQNDHGEFASLASEERGLPKWESLSYEIDMMVADPARLFDEWVTAGASALIVHIESVKPEALDDLFLRADERSVELGIALKPSTDLSVLEKWIEKAAFIQCMGNDLIGRQGTPLDEVVYSKIADIHARYGGVTISVDIGVTEETAPRLIASGASKLVSGSAIFDGERGIGETIKWFKSL